MLSGIARFSALNGPWTFYRKLPDYLKSNQAINLKELVSWRPDGVISSISGSTELKKLNIPMIGYDPGAYDGDIPCVVSDDAEAGRLAARHLLDMGHRNFAYCGYSHLPWSQDRGKAFSDLVEESGAKVHVYHSRSRRKNSWAKEEEQVRAWLKSLPIPIGLFCANDDRTASIMEICRALEFGVPEDISIIGVDDDEYVCELQNPPLSSIRIASEQAGFEAAGLLLQMIQKKKKMEGQRIVAAATGVTARQSTDVLMVQNTEVRKALKFIRENCNRPVRVSDVVDATALSHRALNERFNTELGCSIVTQLTRAKIDYITRLLTETDMRIQEIALNVGYEDDRHFSRYFKRATGLTPQAYRRKFFLP
jgi:LacI family transcriptional regulator